MSFYGDLPTETRVSDSGAEYTVKVDPAKTAKNKAKRDKKKAKKTGSNATSPRD